jgi:uncharacterized protein YggU (UPF0235/DUF167 family)
MIIDVNVKPGKKEGKIEVKDRIYFIEISEKAEKGKANLALIKLLSKHFKTSSANIRIIRGFSSHKKIIEVKG